MPLHHAQQRQARLPRHRQNAAENGRGRRPRDQALILEEAAEGVRPFRDRVEPVTEIGQVAPHRAVGMGVHQPRGVILDRVDHVDRQRHPGQAERVHGDRPGELKPGVGQLLGVEAQRAGGVRDFVGPQDAGAVNDAAAQAAAVA